MVHHPLNEPPTIPDHGNVRTQTLRAFSAADMKNVLGKMS
jgi:uncharacterized protein with GYD domain